MRPPKPSLIAFSWAISSVYILFNLVVVCHQVSIDSRATLDLQNDDGTPVRVTPLDKDHLASLSLIERAALLLPLAAGFGAATLHLLTLPLLFTTLSSPQALCFCLMPSFVATLAISEARNVEGVNRVILGEKFYRELHPAEGRS